MVFYVAQIHMSNLSVGCLNIKVSRTNVITFLFLHIIESNFFYGAKVVSNIL